MRRSFWDSINKSGRRVPGMRSCCWEVRRPARSGYGTTSFRGRRVSAHKRAWEERHGPVPFGLLLLHLCDNPRCVLHLALGTPAMNSYDAAHKERLHSASRLPRAVREMRAALYRAEYPQNRSEEWLSIPTVEWVKEMVFIGGLRRPSYPTVNDVSPVCAGCRSWVGDVQLIGHRTGCPFTKEI